MGLKCIIDVVGEITAEISDKRAVILEKNNNLDHN